MIELRPLIIEPVLALAPVALAPSVFVPEVTEVVYPMAFPFSA
jgi:hypothetical protein